MIDSVDLERYTAPFPFSGHPEEVVPDTSGELTEDPQAELERLMAQQ